jgi:hypothetical protein
MRDIYSTNLHRVGLADHTLSSMTVRDDWAEVFFSLYASAIERRLDMNDGAGGVPNERNACSLSVPWPPFSNDTPTTTRRMINEGLMNYVGPSVRA